MIILKRFGLLLILMIVFSSCRNNEDSNNLYDLLVAIDVRVELTDPKNQVLNLNNGYLPIEGGRRGIIVYRKSSTEYIAFERSCSFQPSNDCATISMHPSVQFLVDSCCSSQFDLNGTVRQGPATQPLVQYSTFLIGSELRITFP